MQETQETLVPSLGWEEPLEKENGLPFQYSCLKNPIDRGAWWATIHVVAESQTQLSNSFTCIFTPRYTALTHGEEPCLQAHLTKYGRVEIENGNTAVPSVSFCVHRSVHCTLADVMTGKNDSSEPCM